MSYKSVLAPHHSIPPPILSILVGRLPQVSTTVQDVTEEAAEVATVKKSKDKTDTEDDSWDKDWGWGDEEDGDEDDQSNDAKTSSSPADTDSQDTATTPVLAPLTEPYLVSASANGRYMVLAHESKFVVIELIENDGEYSAVGQGSGCEAEGETITAILCLALFVPSIRKNQIFVMAGYSTGWIRVFSETGTLLTAQLLEPSPVLSLKLRTPPSVFKVSPHVMQHEDEEITILFQNKRVVSIDGQSLWMVLRVCDGQRESGIDASRMQTAFAYKKYEFQKQEQIKDIVSLGPSPPQSQSTVLDGVSTTHTTYPFPSTSTSRYIAVGAHPMLCYYATSESTRPLISAVSMASYVVSRVASPVFSLAKSWWSGNSAPSSRSNSPTPYVPDMHPPPSHIEPASAIPPTLTVNDSYRRITSISTAPPSTSAQRYTLAVTSDMLGRVILWDVQSGEMIRMWKGIRDAVCGWVEKYDDNGSNNGSTTTPARVLLFLVIYSERRGLVLTYQMRHGKQVGMYRIGQGWRLVQCGREPLGSSMVSIERRRMAMQKSEGECGCLAKCLLIGPDGQVRNVEIENVS